MSPLSPYFVEIFPDHTNGHNCSAVGPGLSTATSDVETYFTIQARDVFSNPLCIRLLINFTYRR